MGLEYVKDWKFANLLTNNSCQWRELAQRVLDGGRLAADEGLALLRSGDEELLDLLAAAYRVRHRWFGNRVELNFLVNAKSGLCSEDCGYCSQSRVSKAEIPRYPLLGADEVLDGARAAAQWHARTYCAVISGRSPSDEELDTLAQVVPRIKADYGLKVCFSVGLLTLEQARRLKDCGVDRVNHNLNTSERFYPQICSTHSYQDRLETLRNVRQAGLEICSGGIVGMGEEDADVVELALRLGELRAEAVPVNFLLPIAGIPLVEKGISPILPDQPSTTAQDRQSRERGLAPSPRSANLTETACGDGACPLCRDGGAPSGGKRGTGTVAATSFPIAEPTRATEPVPLFPPTVRGSTSRLNPRYCLKVLALFRFANPRAELRVAAGREVHLGPLQPLCLYPANSIFVGDYLTTRGQPPEEDYGMIEALGFSIGGGS